MNTPINLFININSNPELNYTLIRAFILFLFAVILIRLNKRLHIETSFDFVIIIMIGAMLERGIFLDSTTLLKAMGVSVFLIVIQKIFAYSTFYSKGLGKILKGEPIILYQNGRFHRNEMKSEQVTEEDIMSACRRDMQCTTLESIKEVNLERTGKISFIKK